MLTNCPICNDALIFPRDYSPYCEDCGWPDEDFNGEFIFPEIGEKLENYQPGLEFFDGEKWIPSGIIKCKLSSKFHGLYRIRRVV